jgi:uncharacterized protein
VVFSEALLTRVEETVSLPQLPVPLCWYTTPERWALTEAGGLTARAGAGTDLFVDPLGPSETLNAPRLLARPTGDFQLRAWTSADFQATYDAAALILWVDHYRWAKLAFEEAPDGRPMVVSVVTRGSSDDCNAFYVDDGHIWLRVSRIGHAYAFHASFDGESWRLIRYFALDDDSKALVGFEVQSPSGLGCTATFERIRFIPAKLSGLRDGS